MSYSKFLLTNISMRHLGIDCLICLTFILIACLLFGSCGNTSVVQLVESLLSGILLSLKISLSIHMCR